MNVYNVPRYALHVPRFMFLDPTSVLKKFGIAGALKVADLGAGSGAYTLAAARMLQGGESKVYACEILPEMAETLRKEASRLGLKNVEVLWANIEKRGGTKLSDGSVDAVIASNILFQVEDKNAFCHEAARILKKGGRALLVEWSESFGHMGPHPNEVITKEKALEYFKRAGFSETGTVDAGAHHYGVILRKA